ncbi:MAG: DUF1015 domain-containing protein [Anaerolineales bacterium]|jgi:hypothetical protein|nr:DUF1015 domain-containing protein [Anaerolineales bacterium]
MNRTYDRIGIQIPEFYLPRPGVDLARWAVIACDQFTSEPEYWEKVEQLVGDAPSTLRLILPEVSLEKPGEAELICQIQAKMAEYLDQGILERHEGMVYVERTVAGKTRRGLVLCLDLERYDYNRGSQSLIRATEGTILDRLPPRMKIREGALLELPHILVLIDDPERSVIEPLNAMKASLPRLYDFDLMLDSGHLTGYLVSDPKAEAAVVDALGKLADQKGFSRKYHIGKHEQVLLFAMGDGNHSLATAKAIWEKIKDEVGMDHPARYALVEIENIHDEGLEFEPIHRVLFGLQQDPLDKMQALFGADYAYQVCANVDEMVQQVDTHASASQVIGVVSAAGCGVISIAHPPSNLAVGTLQGVLDAFLKERLAEKIDYVHGRETVERLGSLPGNIGFYLPAMSKDELFRTVILDGALPRKTFSMGEAREKRFYMESRAISA